LTFQLEKRGRPPQAAPVFEQVGDDKIISSASWTDADGKRAERYQVITFRDGKIIDMQGCTSRRAAERFARAH